MFNKEAARRTLLAAGLCVSDTDLAIYFAEALIKADSSVFPDTPVAIRFFPNRPVEAADTIAAYNEDSDRYMVIVPGISEILERESRLYLRQFDLDGAGLTDEVQLGPTEQIVRLAIHEVRHRIQTKLPDLKLITPESSTENPLLASCIRRQRGYFQFLSNKMVKGGSSAEEIQRLIRPREFDAQVIQRFVFHTGLNLNSDASKFRGALLM